MNRAMIKRQLMGRISTMMRDLHQVAPYFFKNVDGKTSILVVNDVFLMTCRCFSEAFYLNNTECKAKAFIINLGDEDDPFAIPFVEKVKYSIDTSLGTGCSEDIYIKELKDIDELALCVLYRFLVGLLYIALEHLEILDKEDEDEL